MPDDIDAPDHEPLRKAEPVVLGDIVDLVVILAGTAGVIIPDDVAAKVVAAVVAVVIWLQSTYLKRKSVTPVAKAEAAVVEAVAVERAASAPWVAAASSEPSPGLDLLLATVKDLGRVEPVAPPAPPPVGLVGGVSGLDRAP